MGLALGMPWLLLPNAWTPSGCAYTPLLLSLLCFWIASTVLVVLGLRWCWRRLLFKVSRRLYLILFMVSILPELSLSLAFLSVGWLGLGAQVNRTIDGHLLKYEEAVRQAGQQGSDQASIQILQPFGNAWVDSTDHLPEGVKVGFLDIVYDRLPGDNTKGLMFRLVQPSKQGFRLLSLDLQRLPSTGQNLWGGRMNLCLDWAQKSTISGATTVTGKNVKASPAEREVEANLLPVYETTFGKVAEGKGIFKAFSLPPVVRTVVDWESNRPMLLTLTPQTNLVELFSGFGINQKKFPPQTAISIALVIGLIFVLVIFQMVALITGLTMTGNLGRSVHELFKGVQRLSQGDYSTRIRPLSYDQVGALTRAYNDMAKQLEIAEAEREDRLRMEEELRVARDVQMRLLPDMAGFAPSIQATILPAREVAGDYFDVLRLNDGRMAFLIADVSGKGTSAAFYAAETKGVLAALDKVALSPVDVVERLNGIWWVNHPRPLFLTLVYGLFDPHSGDFSFVRAGHPPAFLRRVDGHVERLSPKGLGIGMCGPEFRKHVETCEGMLEVGDSLIFYTDGLSEAMNPQNELFGEERLETLLRSSAGDAQTLILSAVETFAEGRPLEDDLTLLVLQR